MPACNNGPICEKEQTARKVPNTVTSAPFLEYRIASRRFSRIRKTQRMTVSEKRNAKKKNIFDNLITKCDTFNTPCLCFAPYVLRLFSFNAPLQFFTASQFALSHFRLTPCSWLRSLTLTPHFLWKYFLFTPTFPGTLRRKTGAGCTTLYYTILDKNT